MPNRNSGLAELAQMMQLVNGGGQDNAAAQQQHAGLQWMQMQQQRQQQEAEMALRQQQLELQGRHYGDDVAYKDRALAQQGRFEEANLAKQQALFDQRAAAETERVKAEKRSEMGRIFSQLVGMGQQDSNLGKALAASLLPDEVQNAKTFGQMARVQSLKQQLGLFQGTMTGKKLETGLVGLKASYPDVWDLPEIQQMLGTPAGGGAPDSAAALSLPATVANSPEVLAAFAESAKRKKVQEESSARSKLIEEQQKNINDAYNAGQPEVGDALQKLYIKQRGDRQLGEELAPLFLPNAWNK